MSKVSIIIPCFNVQNYITECLDSIRKQTFKDFEIIVVNDGSTDNTEQKIIDFFKLYSDINHKYVYQENRGLGAARNTGILNSSSEILTFLDADDLLIEVSLEERVNFFLKDSVLIFLCSDAFILKDNKVQETYKKRVLPEFYGKLDLTTVIQENVIVMPSVMVRRSIFERIGLFDPDFSKVKGVEDYDMWLRILSTGVKSIFIDKPLVIYRVTGTSMSSDVVAMHRNLLYVYNKNLLSLNLSSEQRKLVQYRINSIEKFINKDIFLSHINKREYSKAIQFIPSEIKSKSKLHTIILKLGLKICPNLLRLFLLKKLHQER